MINIIDCRFDGSNYMTLIEFLYKYVHNLIQFRSPDKRRHVRCITDILSRDQVNTSLCHRHLTIVTRVSIRISIHQ